MIFRDTLVVIVDDNDQIARVLAGVIQGLQRLTAGEGTVADQGDDIFRAVGQIPRLRKAQRQRNRSRSVSDGKHVVLTLKRIRKSRHIRKMSLVRVRFPAPRKNLVRVALVGNIKHDLVLRRIEDIVKRNRKLHNSQVRADVPALLAHPVDDRCSRLVGEDRQFCHSQLFDVIRAVNLLQKHT